MHIHISMYCSVYGSDFAMCAMYNKMISDATEAYRTSKWMIYGVILLGHNKHYPNIEVAFDICINLNSPTNM